MSKLIKSLYLIAFLLAFLASCSLAGGFSPNTNIDNPYIPQSGDASMVRGDVEIVKTEVAPLTSSPAQFQINISYFLPTPCDKFRLVVNRPDTNKQINIEAYSLMKPGQVCNLMRLSTPSVATLNLGGLPSGSYTVILNGTQVTKINI